jgi:cytochrome c oxidase subunit 2
VIILFMLWFILKVRRSPQNPAVPEKGGIDRREMAFFGGLVAAVVLAHVITLSNLVPWQAWNLWSKPVPTGHFNVEVADYQFKFPRIPLEANAGQIVEFDLTSKDVTYGFGVFRKDGTMVFQFSVIPGHNNRFVWKFSEPGYYDVRSTEYSGAEHSKMLVRNAILVSRKSEVGHGN